MTGLDPHILIIGGGFSGLAAAIALRERGYGVDLVEIQPEWTTYGAGISIGGATLRALRRLHVLERFLEEGFAGDGTEIRTPAGAVIARLPTPRVAGPEVPGNGAVMRPVLARILADAALAAGAAVRLGCTFKTLEPRPDGVPKSVHVSFTDGSEQDYDLVIGADGMRSAVRTEIFPNCPEPRYNGQGVWRAVAPRPEQVTGTILWVGDQTKVGINPVSKDEVYLFVNENRPDNERVEAKIFVSRLKALLAPFPAPEVQTIRAGLSEDSHIVFRPIEGMLLPRPWHKGRIVLIGDAVHATTPHLASGAGIGIEDAIVLAEEIERQPDIDKAIIAFENRRWERCRMVVENSMRLGEIETEGGSRQEHAALMRTSFLALAEEI